MSEATRGYRELVVWQRAIDPIPHVYELAKRFPHDERFGLTSQMQRAVVSIAANIAEGQARQHPKEFLHHLSIARGSLAEVDTLIVAAERIGYLADDGSRNGQERLIEVRRLIQGLMHHLQ